MSYHIRLVYISDTPRRKRDFARNWTWQVADPVGIIHSGRARTARGARRQAERLALQLAEMAYDKKPLVYEFSPVASTYVPPVPGRDSAGDFGGER